MPSWRWDPLRSQPIVCMHALGLDNVDHVGHPDITDKGNLDNVLLGA